MDLLNRISTVLNAEKNDAQLDKFLSDVRDSLASTNRLFLAYQVSAVTSLVVYHIVVYGGSTSISFGGVQLLDTALFRRVFLVLPAALIGASAGLGYLRKLQRETYDFLTISRYRVLGQTGLHELRLPADFILGLFLMKNEGGLLGKVVSYIVISGTALAFTIGPLVYVTTEAIKNVELYGRNDWLCLGASITAILLSLCTLAAAKLVSFVQADGNITTKSGASSSDS